MPTVTPVGDIQPLENVAAQSKVAGEVISNKFTPGYLNTADNKIYIAKANMDLVGKKPCVILTPCGAIDDEVIVTFQTRARIKIGVSIAKDDRLFPNTSGVFCDDYAADLGAGDRIHWWGFGDGTDFIFDPDITDYTK